MSLVGELLRDPIFAKCNYVALSRMLPYIEERSHAVGETLFRANTSADGLFLLVSGVVRLKNPDGTVSPIIMTRFGEECGTDFDSYFFDAVAETPVKLLYVPRRTVHDLITTHADLKTEFELSLMRCLSGRKLKAQGVHATKTEKEKEGNISDLVGWLLTIILPLVVLTTGQYTHLEPGINLFLAIFSATVVMWVFSLVDDYIPGLFAVTAILISGLVPPNIVLVGFTSDSFLMAMSILGLGSVIVTSGLSYRGMLLLLYYLPNSRFWHNFGIAMVGLFLTPLIPSINGRLALVTPFCADMVQNLRFTPQRQAATQLVVSAFAGISLLSAIFISSKSVNFAVFGLLPAQAQDQFQGFKWVVAASVFALVLLLAHVVSTILMFRSREVAQLDKARVAEQLKLLGNMKQREWAATLGIVVFIMGMMTASYHQVPATWVGMAILFSLLMFGSLRKRELTEKVDWPFLLYLSGLTGIVSAFNYLGIDHKLATALPGLGIYMRDSFEIFVLILFGVISVVRLIVPISVTIVTLATLLMPLAEIYGVSPWVVGFIILILGEIWFLPYQCSYYLQLQSANRSDPL
ncbi:MAG: anion permease, partial [Magnetococcales bacterium]|nr:anion permease [Magnetococcales bacterium]